jgi:hypothetical protein
MHNPNWDALSALITMQGQELGTVIGTHETILY